MRLPQLTSPDYYCRVAERKLAGVLLEHSTSMEEPTVMDDLRHFGLPGCRAGFTEWAGTEQGYPLSLGWDWMELMDGEIRPVMVIAPRTNIMLIDRQGYDMPEATSAAFLWEFIASLPWQRPVAESLRQRPGDSRASRHF